MVQKTVLYLFEYFFRLAHFHYFADSVGDPSVRGHANYVNQMKFLGDYHFIPMPY